jgi:glycosyltransferase involved in cell wall biosynthesis
MILLTESVSIIYVGQGPSIHDLRFTSALKSRWRTREVFSPYEGKSIREIVREINPRVIIAGPLSKAITVIPNDINLPIIGMSHAFDVNYPLEHAEIKSNIQRCAMIIVDCMTIREKIVNEYSYSRPISIIPYGCDFSLFNQTKIFFENKLQILVTRNWTRVHSNLLILKALVLLSDKGIDFHCSFVGDGPTLDEGKRYARNNLEENQYTFYGRQTQTEIAVLMARHWVYLSASESDGSSVSLLESMSAGMICLVSSFPSNIEWVSHGENGFIFKNMDFHDLANQLQNIAQTPKTHLVQISNRSKQRVSHDGNWEFNQRIFLSAVAQFLEDESR